MGRPGLRNYDDDYEARRGNRKRAKYSGEVKISDNLTQKISRLENADEDYVEFLKLLYNYDINSQSYTNEHGDDVSYDEVEDETDPQYKIFLANAKRDGRSYILNLNRKDEFPVSIKYEKESECNNGCKCFCCKKQKDMETQKDAVDEDISLNKCSKDELKNRRFPRTDPRYDSNRSMGGMDVIFEPSDPTSQRNNGNMSRKLSTGKCGASKRQGKCETKIKSCEEKMMEKGCKLVHVRDKDKASDVGEDYALLLENLQCEKWGMKALLRSGCNIKYEATDDDLEILYDSNNMLKKKCEPSEFRKKVTDLLKKPYNPKEYKELWTYVNDQKPVERNMESRRGGVKSYKTTKMGKSYLEYYTDLKERLKEVGNNERKKLKIMRGFSFWLQNLTNAGAFKPWNDTEFLARVAESS
ncbi:uncharacterized protein [Solanum tuberosum]|uniref:uncharacterized protein isoform X1 n=1 Tax=Solanum tuberosum TaxID=4113 RepID=UPI00073A3364|nr:PREDICTED: uncharacterized protein LOC102594712 isoform X1 [Solanum tuberosum]XP_015158624.1 PREDICTED: uncharacterized protein LOC102594712 isoform X1 [Solanum tuberosum]